MTGLNIVKLGFLVLAVFQLGCQYAPDAESFESGPDVLEILEAESVSDLGTLIETETLGLTSNARVQSTLEETVSALALADSSSLTPTDRFPRPNSIRGLYVNAWAAGSSSRMGPLLDLVRQTEVNSLVIDIKDATGFLSHHTEVPLAHKRGSVGT